MENVLVDKDYNAFFTDFGLSDNDPSLSKSNDKQKFDIWEIGSILYQMLVGYHPYESDYCFDPNLSVYTIPSNIDPLAQNLISNVSRIK